MQQLQSVDWGQAARVGFGAYLLGCFVAGYYLVRWRTGQDVRELGSGNAGARNAGRVLGKTGFLLTLAGDFGKGVLAVWAARHSSGDDRLALLALLAVVAGHVWPFQLHFRGGKGVAASLGALLVYDFRLAFAFALICVVGVALTRRTVLPGLFAFVCLPWVGAYWAPAPARVTGLTLLAALVLVAHRKNLLEEFYQLHQRRPMAGETPRS